jgi:hypothetical protein
MGKKSLANLPHPSLPFPRSFSIGARNPQRTATQDAVIIPITTDKMLTSQSQRSMPQLLPPKEAVQR